MKLFAAQIMCPSAPVDINLPRHLDVIERAAALGAAALLFPELSLTGYTLSFARERAVQADDPRLQALQQASDHHHLLIAVGVPLWQDDAVQIGMLIFQPGQPRQRYAKQWLHADETPFFVPGGLSAPFDLNGYRLAPAICFESLQAAHAQAAADAGAQVYLASVAKPARGVAAAAAHYPQIARRHRLPVLMANAVGTAEGFTSAGGSGVWGADGRLLCQAGADTQALLSYDLSQHRAALHRLS